MSRPRTLVRSVRFRITAIAAVVATIVLVVVAGLLLSVQRQQLEDNLDASLARRADVVEGVAAGLSGAPGSATVVLANAAGDDAVVQIVAGDGTVVAATANASGLGPIVPAPTGPADEYRTVSALPVEDDEYRVLSRRTDGDGAALIIHVAQNNDDQRELVDELRNAVGLIVPLAVLVLAAVVWWLVGRTLRPVEAIRREVAGMTADQLDKRLPQPGSGDEIDRLATTMNELIERLEDSTRRQQQFVADASHELRSPLARMRTELEVESAAPADRERTDETYRSVIDEIDGMTALVDDLLVLARSDAGRAPNERRPVDLDDLVLDEVTRARTTSGDVTIDRSGVSAALVPGDPGELRRVVRNLLDNAARHAASRVAVSLAEDAGGDDGHAVLVVADDGPGIDPDEAAMVFERFTRLDDARSRAAGGTGLGLAIARDIVERHGGSLELDPTVSTGARFVVTLPTE